MLEVTLLVAALLVSLVAGLLLVFAIVVMPGLGTLGDIDYLRAFKAIDRVIQDSQPVFVLVWGGSVVAVVAVGVFAVTTWSGSVRPLVLAAVGIYLLGVQLSTFVNNIPLNNQLQRLDLDSMSTDELAAERAAFEPGWNRWNRSRTIFATVSSILLLMAIARL
jgi:uncharacterized membrane protein